MAISGPRNWAPPLSFQKAVPDKGRDDDGSKPNNKYKSRMREIKNKSLAEVVAQHAHGNAEVKKRREKRVCAVAGEIWMDTGSGCFLASRSKGSTDAATAPLWPERQLNAKCTHPSRELRRFLQRALSAATALLRVFSAVELRLQRCINLLCTTYTYNLQGSPPDIYSHGCVHVSGLVQQMLHVLLDTAVASKRLQQAARPLG